MTIEDLAIVINKGFQATQDIMNKRFTMVDERFDKIDQRLVNIESDTSYLKSCVSEIGNLEIEDLKDRVYTIEKKVGIAG